MTTSDNKELENILRDRDWRDLSDLRMSLKKHGWIPEAPALIDEDGIVLNGNTRLMLAAELGIEPVRKIIHIGGGETADAKRLALSVGLNMGQNPLTLNDRKRIGEYLYVKKGWTMERIAEALNVSQQTIGRDLGGLSMMDKPHRPKGGRPKGSTRVDKPTGKPRTSRLDPEAIVTRNEQGASVCEIAAEAGITERRVHRVLQDEHIKKSAVEENRELQVALSQSAQKRLEFAIARETKQLRAAFEQSVQVEIQRRINEMVLPHLREKEAKYTLALKARRGFMDKATYMKILRTLHPDFNTDPEKKPQCDEAFNLFRNLKPALLSEKDDPTPGSALPQNAAEMMEWGRRLREAKAQARSRAKQGETSSVH